MNAKSTVFLLGVAVAVSTVPSTVAARDEPSASNAIRARKAAAQRHEP
jgi:hypothetical protein